MEEYFEVYEDQKDIHILSAKWALYDDCVVKTIGDYNVYSLVYNIPNTPSQTFPNIPFPNVPFSIPKEIEVDIENSEVTKLINNIGGNFLTVLQKSAVWRKCGETFLIYQPTSMSIVPDLIAGFDSTIFDSAGEVDTAGFTWKMQNQNKNGKKQKDRKG